MRLSLQDFDYTLPPEQIAQHPPEQRDGGRLMLLCRDSGAISHHRIVDLPLLLPPEPLVVLNDTKVLRARLRARRATGGKVELLLLEQLSGTRWRCMLRSSKPLRQGEVLELEVGPGEAAEGETQAAVTVASAVEGGRGEVELSDQLVPSRLGEMPLPPYIRRRAGTRDLESYQTVFARQDGSVAAPTAGLHLSSALLARIEQVGATVQTVTLHVGPGTFVPVRHEDPMQHRLEAERYDVSPLVELAIRSAKQGGRPVVAVGTTVVRTLESTGGRAGAGRTDLFIVPGFDFTVVDALFTNFHLPRSTLLMLVCAFGGRDNVLEAYAEAVREGYRFYSYGDAMLIR